VTPRISCLAALYPTMTLLVNSNVGGVVQRACARMRFAISTPRRLVYHTAT
jgi:hypothetical protein